MLYKTVPGHDHGSLCGSFGPVTLTVPRSEGYMVDEAEQHGFRIYRVSPDLLVIKDCVQSMLAFRMNCALTMERHGLRSLYARGVAWSHGVLLRRLGRHRVVWLMRTKEGEGKRPSWRGNVNLVTGLEETWLRDRFQQASCDDDQVVQEIAP
jgi:hypothetical protein